MGEVCGYASGVDIFKETALIYLGEFISCLYNQQACLAACTVSNNYELACQPASGCSSTHAPLKLQVLLSAEKGDRW